MDLELCARCDNLIEPNFWYSTEISKRIFNYFCDIQCMRNYIGRCNCHLCLIARDRELKEESCRELAKLL